MGQRIDLATLAPDFYTAMVGLEKAIHRSGIDPILYELIKIRASQINGCAYCLDMHLRDAHRRGEITQPLHSASAWREAPSLFPDADA